MRIKKWNKISWKGERNVGKEKEIARNERECVYNSIENYIVMRFEEGTESELATAATAAEN